MVSIYQLHHSLFQGLVFAEFYCKFIHDFHTNPTDRQTDRQTSGNNMTLLWDVCVCVCVCQSVVVLCLWSPMDDLAAPSIAGITTRCTGRLRRCLALLYDSCQGHGLLTMSHIIIAGARHTDTQQHRHLLPAIVSNKTLSLTWTGRTTLWLSICVWVSRSQLLSFSSCSFNKEPVGYEWCRILRTTCPLWLPSSSLSSRSTDVTSSFLGSSTDLYGKRISKFLYTSCSQMPTPSSWYWPVAYDLTVTSG